jgi:hypothetical protein
LNTMVRWDSEISITPMSTLLRYSGTAKVLVEVYGGAVILQQLILPPHSPLI